MNSRLIRSLFILSLLVISACSEKNYLKTVPDTVIIDLLVDVHLANALLEKQTNVNEDSLKEVYTSQIMQIHEVDRVLFDSILQHVHLDINRYKTISAAVEDSLSSIKTSLEEKLRIKK